jgi:hypothetical protein
MWKPLLFLALLIFLAVQATPTKRPVTQKPPSSTTEEEIYEAPNWWECGGEELSKLLSYQCIHNDCPKLESRLLNQNLNV